MALLVPAENFASKLLTYFDKGPASPLEEIARALALEIRGLKSSAFEGILLRAPYAAGGIIGIGGTNLEFGRQRFTIAHEIGHYVLETKNSKCVPADLRLWNAGSPKERDANKFAAELILPAKTVAPIINQRGVSIDTANHIKTTFKVSLTTAALRVAELAAEECALVHTVDGVVTTYLPSASWRYRIFTRCRPSKNSMASKLLEDPTLSERSGRVSALAWADGSKFMEIGAEVYEESVHLFRYKTILSFLTAIG